MILNMLLGLVSSRSSWGLFHKRLHAVVDKFQYFNQRLEWAAPKRWSKYTTAKKIKEKKLISQPTVSLAMSSKIRDKNGRFMFN